MTNSKYSMKLDGVADSDESKAPKNAELRIFLA